MREKANLLNDVTDATTQQNWIFLENVFAIGWLFRPMLVLSSD